MPTDDRVKETSTSTGTGAFSLLGAMSGHRPFSAVRTVGQAVRYAIQGVDTFGAPTSEWEVGIGTYSALNTLTRTTILASSNSDAAVNFSAGTKQVWVNFDATNAAWLREKLYAARTYYVATTGSDSNSGLTVGSPFATVGKALTVISDTLDLNGYNVTIQLADGTYTAQVSVPVVTGRGTITIQGNSGSSSAVEVHTTGATAFLISVPVTIHLQHMKVRTTTSGHCIFASDGARVTFSNLDFGVCAGTHVNCHQHAFVRATGAYSITGGAAYHLVANSFGMLRSTGPYTVTLTGTPAFSSQFASAADMGFIQSSTSVTYSGSATGTRYSSVRNSLINTGGAGDTHFPGSLAGSVSAGGQYA